MFYSLQVAQAVVAFHDSLLLAQCNDTFNIYNSP